MKAYLYAYDKVNLGDDLFIRFLVQHYPKVQFYMYSNKLNQGIFKDLRNLHIKDKEGVFPKILKKIHPSLETRYQYFLKNRCECSIYIGGSIFQEYPTWKNIVNWWEHQVRNYKFYVLGANFGPYQTEEYRIGMENVFEKVEDVCFRDKYSYELFSESSRVRYAPDILFALDMPKGVEQKRQILISVINCKDREEKLSSIANKYEACLKEMIQDYERNGYTVKLVSFCKEEGDEEICNRIKNELKNCSQIECLYYNGYNYKEILHEIVASQYIVGTRFHATILGLAAGKRVLPIIYSNKTKNILEDIGFGGGTIDLHEKFKPVLFKDLEKNSGQMDIGKYKNMAQNHFEKLDLQFGGKKEDE